MSVAVAPRMNIALGAKSFAVFAVAEVTGTTANPDHAVVIAVISVVGGFFAMLLQIALKDWLTRHRKPPKHPDHDEEQAELNLLLVAELHRVNAENERLRRKGKR